MDKTSMQADTSPSIKAVFAGTPDFAVPSLLALADHVDVELMAVYTQPDRPSGRGRRTRPSAVKQAAVDLAVPVVQPDNLKTRSAIDEYLRLEADLLVVAAYGLILPPAVIDQPRLALNVHASLLPRWRGAAPIQRAIMAGDQETGISMMRIVPELDAGPVLLKRSCRIEATDTAGSLHDKLALLGGECLTVVLDRMVAGALSEIPQDESAVTYAAKISASDRVLDWSRGAVELARQVRALNPVPVATTQMSGCNVKVWAAMAIDDDTSKRTPGEILDANEHGIDVATAHGRLRITELQPEGKRPMSAAEFVNGFHHLVTNA